MQAIAQQALPEREAVRLVERFGVRARVRVDLQRGGHRVPALGHARVEARPQLGVQLVVRDRLDAHVRKVTLSR